MKKFAFAGALLGLLAPVAFAQASTWAIDPAHSEVDFVVRHMSVSNVHGRFGNLKGTIARNDADVSKSTVSVTIDVSTVDTGVPARDTDLKSNNFFDVGQFPTATFTSTSVSGDASHLKVNGNLTLHGVTHPIELDVDGPTGPVQGMDKKPHSGYSATTTIKRTDFGIGTKYPAAVLGDDIKMTIELEAVKQ